VLGLRLTSEAPPASAVLFDYYTGSDGNMVKVVFKDSDVAVDLWESSLDDFRALLKSKLESWQSIEQQCQVTY
jgi:hypothetical protein